MEITFKITLDKRHQKKNNAYPLKLRVYQDRLYKERSMGIDLPELDWNEELQLVRNSNESHLGYNAKIATLKAKLNKFLLLRDDAETVVSISEIMEFLDKKDKAPKPKPDLIAYGKNEIAKLQKVGRIGNAIVYSCAINKLQAYTKKTSLHFEDITYQFLEKFVNTLTIDGIKVNSISQYLRTLRALFNKALKEDLIDSKCYPFNKFKIKTERTINRALTIEELAKIANCNLELNTPIWHHRNLFLLSYCLIGINFADLLTLKKENFEGDRIVFRRKKTHKIYSIRLHPEARKLFNYYFAKHSALNADYVLPFLTDKKCAITLKKDITQAIKNTNDYLDKLAKKCEIKKGITTYFARYSWANIARSLGYSKDLIAEALGHQYGNRVTGIYLDEYDSNVIDELNSNVIKILSNHN